MATDSPLATVRAALTRRAMTAPGDRLGVAVSGGADSVALLLILHELAPESGLQLTVLHLDHARRPESRADAAFVAALADRLALPLVARRADRLAAAVGNWEAAARGARSEFFRACLLADGLAAVATAHTADDQAETVMLRLLRGTGTRGLAGIWPVVAVPGAGRIIRPALACRRQDLRAWLAARGENWREDPSNRDLRLRRNRIRHELLPALARVYNPNLVAHLAQLADLAREEESYWRAAIAARARHLWRTTPAGLEAPTAALAALPPALSRRLLRAAFAAAKGDLRRIEFQHVERTRALIAAANAPDSTPKRLRFAGLAITMGRRRTLVTRLDR